MKNRSFGCFTILLSLILAVSVLLNLIFVGTLAEKRSAAHSSADPDFTEDIIDGQEHASDVIAVVDLYGVISNSIAGETGDSMVDDVILRLKKAREDDSVKAVILRIDSPGGEVKASDDLYREVVKTRAKKPVVVYMESVAASGGYYTAVGGSYLMASDLTITASIGVIMETINYKDLLPKIGLKSVVFKSGKMKDMLNPARDITPEEQAYVQSLIDETYDKFVGIVAKERHLDVTVLKNGIADGRILTGTAALQNKLIDQLGYFDDAIRKAEELAKIKEAKVIRYQAPFEFSRVLRMLGEAPALSKTVRVEIGPETLKMETGKLYFLSNHLFIGQ